MAGGLLFGDEYFRIYATDFLRYYVRLDVSLSPLVRCTGHSPTRSRSLRGKTVTNPYPYQEPSGDWQRLKLSYAKATPYLE